LIFKHLFHVVHGAAERSFQTHPNAPARTETRNMDDSIQAKPATRCMLQILHMGWSLPPEAVSKALRQEERVAATAAVAERRRAVNEKSLVYSF